MAKSGQATDDEMCELESAVNSLLISVRETEGKLKRVNNALFDIPYYKLRNKLPKGMATKFHTTMPIKLEWLRDQVLELYDDEAYLEYVGSHRG